MANFTGKDQKFGIDISNSTATLTDLTAHITNVNLTGNPGSHLQDTALGDDEHTFLYGVAGSTFDVTGFWNTTTRSVYGGLVGNRTAVVSKTWAVQEYSGDVYTGECLVGDVAISGSVDTVLTFTAAHTVTGVVSTTSVYAPS